jgi:hypothetical protein
MLLALLLPGLSLYFNRRRTLGIWFTILQPTVLGWIVGAVLAARNLKRQRRRHRGREISYTNWAAQMQAE